MVNIINEQVIISLISGLVGSIVGGIAAFVSTTYSIQASAKKALEQEEYRRKLDSKAKFEDAKNALLVESKENLKSIERWNQYHTKFRFNDYSWNLNKSIYREFKKSILDAAVRTYSEIGRHNTLIDYDLRLPLGSGAKDSEIEHQIQNVNKELSELQLLLLK